MSDAINHPLKIINSNDEQIGEALAYCFVLIGLSDENNPSGIRRTILINFIRENYKFYGVEEIKTAFTLLIRGELDESPKHFQNFSPEYFGSVIVQYNKHREKAKIESVQKQRNEQIKNETKYVPDNVQRAKIQQEFDQVVIMPIFEKYKQFGMIETGTTPPKLIYNSLVNFHKVLDFTNDEKKEIYSFALELVNKRKEDIKNHRAVNYQQHKVKLKAIQDLMQPEIENDEIIKESHLICIRKCFDKLIKEKRTI